MASQLKRYLLKQNFVVSCTCLCAMLFSQLANAQPTKQQADIHLQDKLVDTQQANLGLSQLDAVEHFTVFNAKANSAQYNHGAVLFVFHERLYAQWQSSIKDEDAPETKGLFSSSLGGKTWTEPQVLAESTKDVLITNAGWWQHDNELLAFFKLLAIQT